MSLFFLAKFLPYFVAVFAGDGTNGNIVDGCGFAVYGRVGTIGLRKRKKKHWRINMKRRFNNLRLRGGSFSTRKPYSCVGSRHGIEVTRNFGVPFVFTILEWYNSSGTPRCRRDKRRKKYRICIRKFFQTFSERF